MSLAVLSYLTLEGENLSSNETGVCNLSIPVWFPAVTVVAGELGINLYFTIVWLQVGLRLSLCVCLTLSLRPVIYSGCGQASEVFV